MILNNNRRKPITYSFAIFGLSFGLMLNGQAATNLESKLEKDDTKEMVYESDNDFYEGMARIEQDDKYGFIDKNNKIVIPVKYDDANAFFKG